MDYEDLLPEFTVRKIRYLVVGAVGGILSGYFRSTADVDLMADMKKNNLKKIVDFMSEHGYRPHVPVPATALLDSKKRKSWREEKHLRAFTFIDLRNPLGNVDLLIYAPIEFHSAWKRRQTVYVKNTAVHVASLDDLIKLKEDAIKNRALLKDVQDLAALQELRERKE